jgi:acetyl-CoA carboxylase alpha subunit
MRITADDALSLGIIDGIVAEPEGGAHTDVKAAAELLRRAIDRTLADLDGVDWKQLPEMRYEKFRAMGAPENCPAPGACE